MQENGAISDVSIGEIAESERKCRKMQEKCNNVVQRVGALSDWSVEGTTESKVKKKRKKECRKYRNNVTIYKRVGAISDWSVGGNTESKVKKKKERKYMKNVKNIEESRCYIGLECWRNDSSQLVHGIRYSLSLNRRTENLLFVLNRNSRPKNPPSSWR